MRRVENSTSLERWSKHKSSSRSIRWRSIESSSQNHRSTRVGFCAGLTRSYLSSQNTTKAGFKNKLKNRSLLDPRIKVVSRDARRKNALAFIKKGTYTKLAEEMRNKTARALVSKQTLAEALKPEIPADSHSSETPTAETSTSLPPPPHNPVPVMEWWDAAFLPAELADAVKDGSFAGSFDGSDPWASLRFDQCITKEWSRLAPLTRSVIEHPVPVERNRLPAETAPVVMYTKKVSAGRRSDRKERKKERRLQRAQREEAKRNLILSGAIPAPEPKVGEFRGSEVANVPELQAGAGDGGADAPDGGGPQGARADRAAAAGAPAAERGAVGARRG